MDREAMTTIGDKIRKVIEEKNISQQQLSVETKISPPKLNLIITGKRRMKLEELEVICWALQVGVDTFIVPKPPRRLERDLIENIS